MTSIWPVAAVATPHSGGFQRDPRELLRANIFTRLAPAAAAAKDSP
jgi:hypothetical protein